MVELTETQRSRWAEADRQAAWELWVETSTRAAVVGKPLDPGGANLDGEILAESLDSLYTYFQEARTLQRRIPVGSLPGSVAQSRAIPVFREALAAIRPFLERWQYRYRRWWAENCEGGGDVPAFQQQQAFPEYEAFVQDWAALRRQMRAVQERLFLIIDENEA